jgi:prophage regulatory protein
MSALNEWTECQTLAGSVTNQCLVQAPIAPRGTAFDGNIGTSIDSHEVTTMSQPSQREPAFLRRKDVQIRTGLARSTIYLYVQQGSFPKPVTLGPRAVAWLESEVSAWITERVRIARDVQREAR